MASLAAMGFITGLAKGATKRIEKEREDNEALIESRLKMAAATKIKLEKELEAQKAMLNERYEQISSYLPPDATEEQKLALVSNGEIAKQYADLRAKGEDVDLNRFITVNKDKIPTGFTSVRQYIDTISAAPQALTPEQVAAATQGRRLFMADTGVGAGRAEKLARQYGASAAELLAYEQPQQLPQLSDVARMDASVFKPKRDFDQRISAAESTLIDVVNQFGEESPEAKAAIADLSALHAIKNVFTPDQVKFADVLDKAKLAVANAKTPEERDAAEKELDRLINIGKRDKESGGSGLTYPQMVNTFRAAVGTAVESAYPQLKDNIAATTDPQTGITDYRYIGNNPTERAKVQNTKLQALKSVYRYFSDADGMPANDQVRVLLTSMGVNFDEAGRPVFAVEVPAEVSPPPTATRAPTAERTQQQPQQSGRMATGVVQNSAEMERLDQDIAALTREIELVKKQPNSQGRLEILNAEMRKLQQRKSGTTAPTKPALRWNPATNSWE